MVKGLRMENTSEVTQPVPEKGNCSFLYRMRLNILLINHKTSLYMLN